MSWAVRRGFAALATATALTVVTGPVHRRPDRGRCRPAGGGRDRRRPRTAPTTPPRRSSRPNRSRPCSSSTVSASRRRSPALEIEVAKLREQVETVAVDRFVASGVDGIPILTDLREPSAQLQADVFAQVVAETGATTIDDYDQAKERLAEKRSELNETERALERSKQQLVQLQAAAEAEVERLRAIESDRLENEAVAAAVAAQQRETARQLSEVERRMAESARNAAPTLGVRAAGGGDGGFVRWHHHRQHRRQRRRGGRAHGRRRHGHQPAGRRRGLHRRHHLPSAGQLGLRRLVGSTAQRRSPSSGHRPARPDRHAAAGGRVGCRQPGQQPARRGRAPAVRRQRQSLLLRPPVGVRGRQRAGSRRAR